MSIWCNPGDPDGKFSRKLTYRALAFLFVALPLDALAERTIQVVGLAPNVPTISCDVPKKGTTELTFEDLKKRCVGLCKSLSDISGVPFVYEGKVTSDEKIHFNVEGARCVTEPSTLDLEGYAAGVVSKEDGACRSGGVLGNRSCKN